MRAKQNEPALIHIPPRAREQRLAGLPVSARLRHIFAEEGFSRLGDLHGVSFRDFQRLRHCSRKALRDLRQLVRAVQRPQAPAPTAPAARRPAAPRPAERLCVAASGHTLSLLDLPISARLEGVLQRKGMTRLGDLHGLPVRELYALRNCGSHTVSELVSLLERVAAGEFQLPSEPFSPAQLGGVLLLLERGLAQLPPRDREMLLLRLGATDNRPWTLEEVGAKFNRTRERVRQVEERMLHAVRRAGGPTLIAQLRGISALCHDLVCPLTPGLLTQWAGPTTGRPQLPPAACLRLLAKLHPDIPAWPEGQQLSSTDQARARAIVSALKDLLHDEGPTLPLKGAWELTRARAGLGDLRVAEFLAALQHGRPAIVQFPRPDQPEVCWPRLWLTNVAKDILASSDRPLTPEEILARAQAAFGSERVHWRPRTLLEKLTPERGFYQLGPRRLGLRRHFKLPEGLWPTVRADVHKLLEQERHPISTAAVVREPSFPWAQQTTAHELANILHEDERFRRVGKRRFALAAWASSNQPT